MFLQSISQITTRDNGNVQYHDQEKGKLNSTIKNGVHTLTHDKIVKTALNKNNVATIKSK